MLSALAILAQAQPSSAVDSTTSAAAPTFDVVVVGGGPAAVVRRPYFVRVSVNFLPSIVPVMVLPSALSVIVSWSFPVPTMTWLPFTT